MACNWDNEDEFIIELLFEDDPLMQAMITEDEGALENAFAPSVARAFRDNASVEDFLCEDSSTDNDDEEMQVCASPPTIEQPHAFRQKDGSVCVICNEPYMPGQLVYESNNPQCGHQFHKTCMDKWLQFQNSCPTCNDPFVLQTV